MHLVHPPASNAPGCSVRRLLPTFGVIAALLIGAALHAADEPALPPKAAAKVKPAPSPQALPSEVLDPAAWRIAPGKSGLVGVSELDRRPVMTVTGAPVTLAGTRAVEAETEITLRLRLSAEGASSVTLTTGLKDAADLKEKGLYVTLAGRDDEARWTVFDANSADPRRPTVTGVYRPHFAVERSLAWPDSLRRTVE
ncbi:MAG TPA: hypothetical protein VGO11_27705, partial [Chthoniobacteraceae bacterium]|nr:hypothetical protein [Chthoniobacteraceae bacterium]